MVVRRTKIPAAQFQRGCGCEFHVVCRQFFSIFNISILLANTIPSKRLKGKNHDINYIPVYRPTLDCTNQEEQHDQCVGLALNILTTWVTQYPAHGVWADLPIHTHDIYTNILKLSAC